MLAERGEDVYGYIDRLAEMEGLTPEEAIEEVVCDAVPVILFMEAPEGGREGAAQEGNSSQNAMGSLIALTVILGRNIINVDGQEQIML